MKTIIHDNNDNHVNVINWDADYDGDIANISVNSNIDGKRKHYGLSLDNQDLANLLTIPSVNTPIDKRLKMDFQEPYYSREPYLIELPRSEIQIKKPEYLEIVDKRISSPSTGEELIIPLTIDRKTKDLFTLTPHKKHRRSKTHITHKVYKKHKTSKSKSKSKSKSNSKTSRRKTIPIIELL
jgi:hypothetical protein